MGMERPWKAHHFIWRFPKETSQSEMLERNMKTAQSIKEKIHVYHTCAMQKEAMMTFGCICGIK